MYPHWNARDNYRFGTKKKKRTKREKALDASKGMCGASALSDLKKLCCAKNSNNMFLCELLSPSHNITFSYIFLNADTSMKKCRARFGLDQHNLWCKPCK